MKYREAAEYALDAMKKKGAQLVTISASEGYTDELNAHTGEFDLYRKLYNSEISLVGIKDGKKGTATVSNLDKSTIDEAVDTCIAAANEGTADDAFAIAEFVAKKEFSGGVLVGDREELFHRIKEFMTVLAQEYPKLNLRQMIGLYTRTDSVLLNSNGVDFTNSRGYYTYSSTFSGQDEGLSTSFASYRSRFQDLNTPFIDMGMQRIMIENSLQSFAAQTVAGKYTGTVILTPSCVGGLIGSMLQRFAGESGVVEGTSIWKDKLGSQVLHPSLTLAFKPWDPQIVCGERYTSDGYESVDTTVIKNGVLEAFLLSLYGAKKSGQKRAGTLSGSMVIEAGDKPLNDIIGAIDKGLMVYRFSGGNPAGNGDFSGIAKNSFAIENGKIAGAVSETMISGNLEKLFQNVVAISLERICEGNSVLPWIAIDGVTVSGSKA
ncbi:MAG: TldD/PmbA family protein [Symbiobacteriaceae bacterium]|nr:TldD/PmbA family protein [Symbiobacteriaceae bacterium]